MPNTLLFCLFFAARSMPSGGALCRLRRASNHDGGRFQCVVLSSFDPLYLSRSTQSGRESLVAGSVICLYLKAVLSDDMSLNNPKQTIQILLLYCANTIIRLTVSDWNVLNQCRALVSSSPGSLVLPPYLP